MPELITVNGTSLDRLVSNVESLAGLLRTPQRRGESILVPGRHGRLSRADRPYDQGQIVLPMWVVGADAASGATLSGDAGVTAFYARVDELIGLFCRSSVTIDHTLPSGQVRRAVCELAEEPLDFTRQLGSPLFGRVSVALSIPDGCWFEPTTRTSGPYAVPTNGTVTLSEFTGATAPMADLTVTFTGPLNNPQLTAANGSFVAYDGLVTAGQSLVIDTGLEEAKLNGVHIDYTKLRYRAPRWFEVDPTAGLTVSLVHTSGGNGQFTVSGRRKFLTG